MLRFYTKKFPGIGQLAGVAPVPPVRVTRQLARLSRGQLAIVLGCSVGALRRWETDRLNPTVNRLAWLIYLAYIRPDPATGWLKAVSGLAPDGTVAPEVAQTVAPQTLVSSRK